MSLVLFIGLLLSPPGYSAVVVDAHTNRPLAGVSVRDFQVPTSNAPITTDAAGRFTIAIAPVHIQLRRLGYASLEVNRLPHSSARPDTIRLLPQTAILSEVVVTPGKAISLSTLTANGPRMSRQMLPGQSVAMLLLPPPQAAGGRACALDQISLFLANPPEEGRLRVRLVNVLVGLTPGAPPQPGLADLLPEPIIFTAAQMASLKRGRLLVDVSKYALPLPPDGLCVVVDCLPSNPADQVVSFTKAPSGKPRIQVVLAPNPNDLTTAHTIEAKSYPLLEGQRGLSGGATWSRTSLSRPWAQHSGTTTNIRAEIIIYLY